MGLAGLLHRKLAIQADALPVSEKIRLAAESVRLTRESEDHNAEACSLQVYAGQLAKACKFRESLSVLRKEIL